MRIFCNTPAAFGLALLQTCEQAHTQAQAISPVDWMMKTFEAQIKRLRALLEKHGHPLNPPWPEP
jgi:hypothetical protein